MKKIYNTLLLTLTCATAAVGQDMTNSMVYTELYITGDATPHGWSIGDGQMERTGYGLFEWDGKLEAGKEFKFMNHQDWYKHIVSPDDNTVVTTGIPFDLRFLPAWSPGESDRKFKVDQTGEYHVTVDLECMKLIVTPRPEATSYPSQLYLTGSAIDNQVIPLTSLFGAEFKNHFFCKPGNLKLMDTPTVTERTTFYVPRLEDVDITYGNLYPTAIRPTTDPGNPGWSVGVAGTYTLYIEIPTYRQKARMFRQRDALYLVGGCCELPWNYWDESNMRFRRNPADNTEMIWEGELRLDRLKDGVPAEEPGKFKILTGQDWNSETFHPYTPDQPLITGDGNISHARISGGDDLKWTITRNGIYRLTLNLLDETLKGELLEETSSAIPSTTETAGIGEQLPDAEKHQDIAVYTSGNTLHVRSASPVNVSVYSVAGVLVANATDVMDGDIALSLPAGVYVVCASETPAVRIAVR